MHHHPPLPFPGSYAGQRDALEHDLRAVRDELAPEALVRIEADLSPAHALRRVADAENADLLVVGSRHRRGLQRIVEGDQAMQVLHGASCAVAVAPDPVAPGAGFSASASASTPRPNRPSRWCWRASSRTTPARASRCTRWSTKRSPDGSGLSVTPAYADALRELIADRRAAAEELLARRLEACEGVTADGEVVVGDPAGELILATEGLDLLVLGSRRWGPVRRLALGSTSERVIRHAACPVLVPPRRADAEHADALLSALLVAAR